MPEIHSYGMAPGQTQHETANVVFSHVAVHDEAKSKVEGRPIFATREVVELRFPADRNKTVVAFAKSVWRDIGGHRVTYAERFAEQYRRFKAQEAQVVEGTPLDEAPFLDVGRRAGLKALGVYTMEQLAGLTGDALRNVGQDGQALKNSAVAYLDRARGTADVTALAAENARLKQMLVEMQQDTPHRTDSPGMTDEEMKALIRERTGAAPRGNPSSATLQRMLAETESQAA